MCQTGPLANLRFLSHEHVMPELPEVETVCRSLVPHVVGRTIVNVQVHQPRLRFPVNISALTTLLPGHRILRIRRRAKYVLMDVDPRACLLLHLGMTGQVRVVSQDTPRATHEHAQFTLDNGQEIRFHDPRRFGWIDAFPSTHEATHPRLINLGIEPLSADFTVDAVHAVTHRTQKPIKHLLMDGAFLVGVGNIYASEALFAAQIHPARPAAELSRARIATLVDAVRTTLDRAIHQGGTTLRDFADADGKAGYFAVSLLVYGREGEPCVHCQRPILRMTQSGRSTFYCAHCQPSAC